MNIEYSQFIGHWSLILWSQTFPSYRNIHMQYSHFIFHVWNFIFLVNFLNTNLHWNDFSFIWKGTHFWSVTLLIRDIKNSLSKSNGSIAFVRRVLTGIFTFQIFVCGLCVGTKNGTKTTKMTSLKWIKLCLNYEFEYVAYCLLCEWKHQTQHQHELIGEKSGIFSFIKQKQLRFMLSVTFRTKPMEILIKNHSKNWFFPKNVLRFIMVQL